MVENSLTMMTKQLETMASSQKEVVIGQVNTDDEGSWSIDVPISAPGKYSFKVYENYGTQSQLASENFEYDISLESTEVSLNLGPSPFNPSSSTLKIELNTEVSASVRKAKLLSYLSFCWLDIQKICSAPAKNAETSFPCCVSLQLHGSFSTCA